MTSDLDRSRVDELVKALGGAAVAELVSSFLCTSAQRLDAVGEGIAAGDPGGIARAAHSLTGVAGTLGFGRVAEQAALLDRVARQGDIVACSAAAAELGATMADLRAGLADLFPESAESWSATVDQSCRSLRFTSILPR